ncbi:MAG: type II toxin-antitoxin system VapC family toxin [Pirellulales bacterium]|nr:type II toxin-antitoxin system VapC family toxin [Pirellulales bacterium]
MGLIFDTSVFVSWERGGGSLDFSLWKNYENVAISVITVSELLAGVHRASIPSRKEKRSDFVETIISRFPILDITVEVAKKHAELSASLSKQGQMIGAHDLLIAATACHYHHAVLTLNISDFQRVPGLQVVDFSQKEQD